MNFLYYTQYIHPIEFNGEGGNPRSRLDPMHQMHSQLVQKVHPHSKCTANWLYLVQKVHALNAQPIDLNGGVGGGGGLDLHIKCTANYWKKFIHNGGGDP